MTHVYHVSLGYCTWHSKMFMVDGLTLTTTLAFWSTNTTY
jgi:hypothetical protein